MKLNLAKTIFEKKDIFNLEKNLSLPQFQCMFPMELVANDADKYGFSPVSAIFRKEFIPFIEIVLFHGTISRLTVLNPFAPDNYGFNPKVPKTSEYDMDLIRLIIEDPELFSLNIKGNMKKFDDDLQFTSYEVHNGRPMGEVSSIRIKRFWITPNIDLQWHHKGVVFKSVNISNPNHWSKESFLPWSTSDKA